METDLSAERFYSNPEDDKQVVASLFEATNEAQLLKIA